MHLISTKKAAGLLKKADNVLILMHENPDVDSLGSAYALLLYFKNRGKRAVVGIERAIPDRHTFFIHPEDLKSHFILRENLDKFSFQWAVCVDTASSKLLGDFEHFLKNKHSLCIDHHKVFNPYCEYNLNIPTHSSACEMIFDILGIKKLNFNMANSLYAGMVFDTGGFRYDSTTPELLLKASKLLKTFKIKTDDIYFNINDNESIERKKLTALIVNTIEVFEKGEAAVSYFPMEFKKISNANESDASDLVHIGQSVKGVFFSLFVKEREDGVSISFRTRTGFDVSELAKKWGGGGHQKASGLKIPKTTLEEVKKTVVPFCVEEYAKWRMKNHV